MFGRALSVAYLALSIRDIFKVGCFTGAGRILMLAAAADGVNRHVQANPQIVYTLLPNITLSQ